MKITITSASETDGDYRSALRIDIAYDDGKSNSLSFMEGEPEDATLSRDYSDVNSIPNLLADAYNAGAKGAELEVEYIEVTWGEFCEL